MQEKQIFRNANCSSALLSKELRTNRTHLTEAMKIHENGATIQEYINALRLEYAVQLLYSANLWRIADIELMVGFNSRTTFYRLFKEKYGPSATEFQNMAEQKRKKNNATER